MRFPHQRDDGWREWRLLGRWFVQSCVFVQWQKMPHSVTLLALDIDPWAAEFNGHTGRRRSTRRLYVQAALLGVYVHVTLVKEAP